MRVPHAVLLLLLGVVLIVGVARSTPTTKVLTVQELRLVDQNGRLRAAAKASEAGADIELIDQNDKVRLRLSSHRDGESAVVEFYDRAEVLRVTIGSDAYGNSGVLMLDGAGKDVLAGMEIHVENGLNMRLGTPGDGPYMMLHVEYDQDPFMYLAGTEAGGSVMIGGQLDPGSPKGRISYLDAGSIVVRGPDGDVRWRTPE